MGGQRYVSAALPPEKTRYQSYRRLGGPKVRSVKYRLHQNSIQVWTGAEILACTGIRTPDRPVRGESLYGLRYPGPALAYGPTKILKYYYPNNDMIQ